MESHKKLLLANKAWVADKLNVREDYFLRMANDQTPEFLWIGCSDSRVPAEDVTGTGPGELFVHRNIANQVIHTDFNMLSVLQYAVEVLKVKHIMVVGHYGCGGVRSTIRCERVGLADNWLRHVQDVREKHDACLCRLPTENAQSARLCELNVVEQVANVTQTSIVRDAWLRGQDLTVHGWIYGLRDGLLRDLECTASTQAEAAVRYKSAIAALTA